MKGTQGQACTAAPAVCGREQTLPDSQDESALGGWMKTCLQFSNCTVVSGQRGKRWQRPGTVLLSLLALRGKIVLSAQ